VKSFLEAFLESELAALLYVDDVVAGDGQFLHIDSISSVSAMPEAEAADRLLETQELRPQLLPQSSGVEDAETS